MGTPSETKVCSLCAETIKAGAKVCPYCRSRQGRFRACWYEYIGILVGIFYLVLAAVVFSWIAPKEEGVGGRSFVGHRDELVTTSTSLDRDNVKPDFWLTGVISNRGDHPWRVHELEVRFLDERGNPLDVRHPDVKEKFVVHHGQEHAFRVALGNLIFTNKNVTHLVRVQAASDGDRPLKPD